jgi:hypothetical protein
MTPNALHTQTELYGTVGVSLLDPVTEFIAEMDGDVPASAEPGEVCCPAGSLR